MFDILNNFCSYYFPQFKILISQPINKNKKRKIGIILELSSGCQLFIFFLLISLNSLYGSWEIVSIYRLIPVALKLAAECKSNWLTETKLLVSPHDGQSNPDICFIIQKFGIIYFWFISMKQFPSSEICSKTVKKIIDNHKNRLTAAGEKNKAAGKQAVDYNLQQSKAAIRWNDI